MAELKILRVFLVLVCLKEISSQELVNEDYYSFEDTSNVPTEAPTYNKNIVRQNTTDALESDTGSGEGEINPTDLSTEKYYIGVQEDLPSAEEIFKAFENETAEATTTSSFETTKEEHIKQIFEKLGVTKDLFGADVTEASTRRDALEKEFLLSASVNGNLQLTNLESVVVIEKDKDGDFLEGGGKAATTPLSANKELEDDLFNIISDKDEEKNFDRTGEDEKLTDESVVKEVTPKTEATTPASISDFEANTPKQEATDKAASTNDLLASSEINYETYYESRFEDNLTHHTKSTESATVDPALYEYEAHSSEDEIPLSTTPTDAIINEFSESHRQDKELDLNSHGGINDKLDFESSTTIAVIQEATTEKFFLDDDVVSTEGILSTSEATNIHNTQSIIATGQVIQEIESILAETLTTEIANEIGNSMDEALENSFDTSTIVPTTLSTSETLQNHPIPLDEAIISITTHTPTARILTESVSLVTENKLTSNEEPTKLSDTNASPCLKLNFTGQLKTNETTIPIPDTASLMGTCDSNDAFVNVSWADGHTLKATLFFNFTEDLLTNVQLNLLNDNTLFEQSKRVELGTTSKEITIEFENDHSLQLTFFEFSTSYHYNSLATSTERFDLAPSSEELQSSVSLIVLQIAVGCVGLLVVIGVAGFYAFKKYRGQRDNFKPNAETAA